MPSPHEGPSRDERAGDEREDPGGEALGGHRRTYRQRRKTQAPFLGGLVGGSVTLTILLVSDGGPLADNIWRVALLLIPLGVACGWLIDHFAPVDHRVLVDVHENGVRIRRGAGRPVVCVPARIATVEDEWAPPDKQPQALVWTTYTGGTGWARLDSFGAARSLRRALVEGRHTGVSKRSRVIASVAGALALALFYAWLLVPRPVTVPEEYEHLEAFCEDPEMVFPGLPAYEGEGPHHIALISERDYTTAVEEASPLSPGTLMGERGWSTDEADAALIACGRISLGEVLDTCTYTPSVYGVSGDHDTEVRLHLARFEYDLYEAATRRHVATVEVEGTPAEDWECPSTMREDRSALVVDHDLGPVVDALAPYVERARD